MKRVRYVIVCGLIAALTLGACGDDESTTTGAAGAAGAAAVPAADTAFDGLATGLEAQGLVVAPLSASSLEGAESGVEITGDQAGSARLFGSSQKAADYAKEVEKTGDATTIVGTAVFQSTTEDDADFFAQTYEGG